MKLRRVSFRALTAGVVELVSGLWCGSACSVISRLFHLFRLSGVGLVCAREGLFGLVDATSLPPQLRLVWRLGRLIERPSTLDAKHRLSTTVTALGPAYVKLGQFLATRPDVVGPVLARELRSLQDRMPPFSQAEAEKAVAAALHRKLSDVFVTFGPPVAAASIAQVHRAEIETPSGRRAVAVKVLRPGIERRFKVDLEAFGFVARSAELWSAEARRLRLVGVIETLGRSVALEMDLRLEAAALSEMAENTRDDPDFRVPTMEWIDGTPLSDRAALAARDLDLPRLGRALIQTFLRHALRDGFFHADMHPGNLFVDAEGRLVAVDFGIMGRLRPEERQFLAEILLGFITRDYRRTAEVHFEAGYVPAHHSVESFAQAIRAIGEPIHNRTAEDISMAKLLTLLFEVTGLFDMRTRPELLMLQKTMVVVEGVARSLDPRLDIWTTAEPVVREWITRNLGPAGQFEGAARGMGEAGHLLARIPGLLQRALRVAEQIDAATRNGVSLTPETLAALGERDRWRRRWGTIALWVIAALLAWGVFVK